MARIKNTTDPYPLPQEHKHFCSRLLTRLMCRDCYIITPVAGDLDPDDGRYYPNEKHRNVICRRRSKFSTLDDSLNCGIQISKLERGHR